MGIFGKKEKEIPSLPELPELPKDNNLILPSKNDLPDVPAGLPKIETSELPSLPKAGTGMQKSNFNINQQMPPIQPPKPLRQITDIPRTIELEPLESKGFIKPSTKKIEPIYIRLDKFETTVEAFEEIKNKIQDIEELLQKTKEIKQKEEQELIEWEREIQIIKSRIDSIDKTIFNKLD